MALPKAAQAYCFLKRSYLQNCKSTYIKLAKNNRPELPLVMPQLCPFRFRFFIIRALKRGIVSLCITYSFWENWRNLAKNGARRSRCFWNAAAWYCWPILSSWRVSSFRTVRFIVKICCSQNVHIQGLTCFNSLARNMIGCCDFQLIR